ncbi:hypothetical protein HYT26_03960 [Candidatus Pacearchaeota archaeon]|nr:hypothetical protein [Candidatus Pacearchaeota archaeon]
MAKEKTNEKIRELKGANMDIDLTTAMGKIHWKQDKCPWNSAEDTNEHRCAVKNISICRYFRGIKPLDIVLCAYPEKKEQIL